MLLLKLYIIGYLIQVGALLTSKKKQKPNETIIGMVLLLAWPIIGVMFLVYYISKKGNLDELQ